MGPLHGVKVVELAGIGPGTVRGDVALRHGRGGRAGRAGRARRAASDRPSGSMFDRGRRSIGVDLKHPDGVETVLRLVEQADALIEGFRPGRDRAPRARPRRVPRPQPEARLRPHDRLGPGRSARAGRRATTSTTSRSPARSRTSAARARKPTPPINIVGDFGGGGDVPRVRRRVRGPRGARLGRGPGGRRGDGRRRRDPDGDDVGLARHRRAQRGARARTCSTPARRSTTRTRPPTASSSRSARSSRSSTRELLELHRPRARRPAARRWTAAAGRCCASGSPTLFKTKTRDEWGEILEGTDVCFAPVLTMSRGGEHPHIKARGTIVEHDGMRQPAPAPRFSRTPARDPGSGAVAGPAHRRGARRLGLQRRRDRQAARRRARSAASARRAGALRARSARRGVELVVVGAR